MAIDAPLVETDGDGAVQEASNIREAIEIDDSSQQVEGSGVVTTNDVPMEVDTTVAAATSASAIPSSRFYGSAEKGKARAYSPRHLSPEVPYPDAVMQEASEHVGLEVSESNLDRYYDPTRSRNIAESTFTGHGFSPLILWGPNIQVL